MQIVLDIYNNCRTLFQQFGTSYSGIYLAFILLLVVLALCDEKNHTIKMFRYALTGFAMIALLGVIKAFWPENYYLGNVDLYMVVPVFILNILLCIYVGDKLKFKQSVMVIIFAVLVLCEASVPLSISCKNRFVMPSMDGKISTDAKQISEIVGDTTVVLPSSLNNEYRELRMAGTQTVLCIYDDGQNYLTNNNAVWDTFSLGVQNDSEFVVVRVVDKLGETNEETIKANAEATDYEVVDQVGNYMIAKKNSESE